MTTRTTRLLRSTAGRPSSQLPIPVDIALTLSSVAEKDRLCFARARMLTLVLRRPSVLRFSRKMSVMRKVKLPDD